MSIGSTVLIVVVLLAGCAGAATTHTGQANRAAPALPPIDNCTGPGPGARVLRFRSGGLALTGVLFGTAPTTFVLSNESDENLCSWLPFVRPLERHGYSVLLYDYLDPTNYPAEAIAAARAALRAGSRQIVFMGASIGARASVEAAALHPAAVAAVITLSAERMTGNDATDLLTVAPHVHAPALLVSARDDPYVSGGITGALLRALHSPRKRALVLPGADHGTSLLTDSYGPRVQSAIFAFVGAGR